MLSVALLMLGQSTQALSLGAIALFLPLIREDVGMSFTQAGTLAAAASLVYAAMQIPSGVLADRVPPKRLFIIGLGGVNLLTFTFAQLHSYALLIINQVCSGFFRSLLFAPGLLLIRSHFASRRQATAMGLYVAGGFSSSILLNLFGPLLVVPLGWRNLLVAFAAFGLFVMVAYWRFGATGRPDRAHAETPLRALVDLLRYRVMWLVAGIQFVRLAVVSGLAFWLPTIIVAEKGYGLHVAGVAVAAGAALTAPSNLIGGYISDRIGKPLLVIGGSLAVLAATTFVLASVRGLLPLFVVVGLNGMFVQLYFGPLFAVPIKILGTRSAGVSSGFGNFFANLGGFVSVYAIGVTKDLTGSFTAGLYCLSALCVAALALTALIARAPLRMREA